MKDPDFAAFAPFFEQSRRETPRTQLGGFETASSMTSRADFLGPSSGQSHPAVLPSTLFPAGHQVVGILPQQISSQVRTLRDHRDTN